MLSSITPLGQRSRGMSWGRTVIAFWLGSMLAGAAVFGAAGLLGEALGIAGTLMPALVALALALLLDVLGIKPFGPHRQVDEDWLGRYRDWVVGFGFGAQLGSGFSTIVPTWGTWALLVVAATLGLPGALVLGAFFGVGRSILLLWTARSTSTSQLVNSLSRFTSAESRAKVLAMLAYGFTVLAGMFYVA